MHDTPMGYAIIPPLGPAVKKYCQRMAPCLLPHGPSECIMELTVPDLRVLEQANASGNETEVS